MDNSIITKRNRVLIFISGLALLLVLFKPIWQIDLQAPQYPEGLTLLIYADGLAGNVDIINGLNHYIGMKTLHNEDFIEFKVLPGIIIVYAVLFMLCALSGKRKWLNILFILFVIFGIVAMIDFWRWEYNYGHNLDPNAAIIVPGQAYQPPLIGFKQLLNFGAYSVPATGGWIFLGAGAVLALVLASEWIKGKAPARKLPLIILLITASLLSACSNEPEPFRLGRDSCDFCKMTISDERFGAQIITSKSKVYKFDDPHCIIAFLRENQLAKEDIAGIYFTDFNAPHGFLKAEDAYFLQSPKFNSPMSGNIAAFSHEDSLAKALPSFYGNAISWEDMQK